METWADGTGATTRTWLHIPSISSATSAELLTHSGCDFLVIDLQHSLAGLAITFEMIQVSSLWQVPVLVRSTGIDAPQAGRVLVASTRGIICSVINNRSEAEDLVDACRYLSNSSQSPGPFRLLILFIPFIPLGDTYGAILMG